MANVEELSFKVFLQDNDYNAKIDADIAKAKELNISVSQYLDLRRKVSGLTADEARAIKVQEQGVLIQQRVATETERTVAAKARAAKATLQQEQAERRLASANRDVASSASNVNSGFSLQGRLLSNLTTLGTAYVSIFAAERFVTNLAKVSGEFELQRISLRAILQDVQGADRVFGQIKELSIVSPFQFKELVGFTKQLSAFSVPMDELYDTMKRLADVSSGLGVDMGRIILAYGQVRSAAVLRGQELRQFTEAGIPLVDMLAKKFSELEGRVVSAGEVFGKISERMVPFRMIKDIFTELTSEGGMFYMMQEKQAESLAGKISNLKDAYDIMLSEIGDANSGVLKGGVDLIAEMFRNWEKIADAIKVAVAAYGSYVVVSKAAVAWQKQMIISQEIAATAGVKLSKTQLRIASAYKLLGNSMKSVTSFLKANAAGLIAAGVVALGVSLYNAYQNANKLRKELEEINTSSALNARKLSEGFKELADQIVNANDGSMHQNELMQKLKRTYSEYLDVNTLTVESLRAMTGEYGNLTQAIYDKAKADAYEKGMQKINEDYGEKSAKYVKQVLDELQSIGIEGKDANNIVNLIVDEIKNNPDFILPGIKNVSRNMNEIVKFINQYLGEDILEKTAGTNGLFQIANTKTSRYTTLLDSYISSLSRTVADYDNEVKKLISTQDILFNQSSVNTKAEADALERINKKYKALAEEITDNNPENKAKKKLQENEIARLNETIDLYKGYGDAVSSAKKKIAGLQAQIDKITKDPVEWIGKAERAIGNNTSGKVYAPQEDENLLAYIGRLRKAYKGLKADVKSLEGESKAGLVGGKESLESAKNQMLALEAIAKALNLSLKSAKEETAFENSLVKSLQDDLDNLKSAYTEYRKIAEKEGTATANKQVKTIFGIDFSEVDLKDRAEQIIQDIAKISGKPIDEIRKKFDTWLNQQQADEFIKRTDAMFDRMKKNLDSYKDKFNLFKQLFDLSGDEEMSWRMSFGDAAKSMQTYIDYAKSELQRLATTGGLEKTAFEDLIGLSDEEKSKLPERIRELMDEIQSEIESREIAIKIDVAKTVADYASVEEKISALQKKYAKERADAEKVLTKEDYAIFLDSSIAKEAEETARLKEELIQLLPVWEQIFGDTAYKSVSQIENGMKKAKEILSNATVNRNKKTNKPISASSFYIDEEGNRQEITLTIALLERLREAYDKLYQERGNKNPFKNLIDDIKNLFNPPVDEEGNKDSVEGRLAHLGSSVSQTAQLIGGVSNALSGMFDAMGNEDAAKAMETVTQVMGSISNIGEGFAKGGVLGGVTAVVTETIGWIGRIFAAADARLQKQIEQSEKRVKRLSNAFKDLDRLIDKTAGGGVYDIQADKIKNLQKQQQELLLQADLERRKKKSDSDKVEDLERQAVEVSQQIDDLVTEIRDEIVGGTAKDIAAELSDAFFEAFQNGEDYAGAWHDKVKELVADIAKRMLVQKFLEEPIQDIIDKYSSQWGIKQGGNVIDRVLSTLPGLTDDLNNVLGIWSSVFEELTPELKELLMGSNEAGESLKSGIQGVTEDTASIIASYMNAIRQDVSVKRAMLAQVLEILRQNQNTGGVMLATLKAIESNTRDTAVAALQAANAALRTAEAAENISTNLNRVIVGAQAGAGYAVNVNA